MLRIKRLYTYILQSFVPVFFMTFAICLFIILMQFLWKYVEDLVGKGLETHVLAELFFYAALTLTPMALPLAILLASLMTFGSLGEKFELTAIKAAGISLLRTMRPLIILIIFISIGAFVFQNDIIPKVNVKFRTLMISIKQKSPELDIPENTFYSEIKNYNLYVKHKDKKTGMLRDVMIYDVSKGFNNMAVIVCDSAKMNISSNKEYLRLTLFNGQQFSNLRQSDFNNNSISSTQFVPYSREEFREKKVIIPFNANFDRIDESTVEGNQMAKNISQLRHSIDSLTTLVDSLNVADRKFAVKHGYLVSYKGEIERQDTAKLNLIEKIQPIAFDSVMEAFSTSELHRIYIDASTMAENAKNDMMFKTFSKIDLQKKIRGHNVELQRKFTLSFACLIFFFIGAPLGAIIRKGGLGVPVVISLVLFIIYYIIDNLGYKMARDGVWTVWQGVWLSSFILFPLGVFITYKAINDSSLFNADAYRNYYIKIFGDKTTMSLNEIFVNFRKNSSYVYIILASLIVLFILKIFIGGFLSTLLTVFIFIALLAYIILIIELFSERYEFYKKSGYTIPLKDIVFAFTLGLLFYFVLYFYYKKKMSLVLSKDQSVKIF